MFLYAEPVVAFAGKTKYFVYRTKKLKYSGHETVK